MRIPKVFWRGATTGGQLNTKERTACRDLKRVRMCLLAKNTSWLDVKIEKLVQSCSSDSELIIGLGVKGRRVPEFGWTQYRGILDIDGNSNAWGLFWRLASGSVVFRVESEFVNQYTQSLKPWVHYIPISNNLSDFLAVTRLVRDPTYRYIAGNAGMFVKDLTYVHEINRVAKELSALWITHRK
eukprot:CAMPEP_0182419298 /NCGR_PEP_ID=MMETSP1167-20130531/3754_1 /TAXON_ID=2988 /ORGANISM="Mallomonas Sp, Strain CCMP3275" /LENGTH=183 /DNA_ID=CAMNT_0024594125 /DNA_START=611 /DNA_END=1162 /DNA_ORIENTATION=-